VAWWWRLIKINYILYSAAATEPMVAEKPPENSKYFI
jgi:hypothetical protein